MKRLTLILFSLCVMSVAPAQTDDEFRRNYDAFKRQFRQEYLDFREKANMQYVEFMKQAWQQYKVLPAIPKPKDETVPPTVMPEEDKDKPIESRSVPIEEVVTPLQPVPQPVPIAPIRENPKEEEEKHVTFHFYGTECSVRFNDDERFVLPDCNNDALAEAWRKLCDDKYNNTVRDCLELRIRMHLCDWAYLGILNAMAEACLGKGNEATLLTAYVYCQSGYKMRLGSNDTALYLLYATDYDVYGHMYVTIDGERYYVYKGDEASLYICGASMPEEQSLSLQIPHTMALSTDSSEVRTLQSRRYPDVKVGTIVNKNLIDFYNTYPTGVIGENFMTRWAMYANTPLDRSVKDGLYQTLRPMLIGLDKKEAAERLLNFVQTAFVYEYDDKVLGGDRAFFAEETLYYPYCDCEDRSILFSRLVRDLLGLDVVLVYYPGHLATAVCFDANVQGDYIMLDGKRFVICDPTYIGAPVGATMPDMDNRSAHVILLGR